MYKGCYHLEQLVLLTFEDHMIMYHMHLKRLSYKYLLTKYLREFLLPRS